MVTSKEIRWQLLNKMPRRTMYNRLNLMKAKTGNSISSSIALDVLVSMSDINVYDILKKEGRDQEITDLQNVLSKFDFDPRISPKRIKSNLTPVLKSDRSPYELPLAKFKLDPELLRD